MTIPVYVVLAVLLMIAAVIGSVTPLVPAGLLSIAGILVYWWSTGYTAPGPLFLWAFVLVGGLVLVADYAAGIIAARAGGASTRNSIAGGVVGLVLFFVLGPLGIILGFAGTVFALEVYGGTGTEESAKAALFAVVGALGSGLVQFLLTASLLVAFVVAIAL